MFKIQMIFQGEKKYSRVAKQCDYGPVDIYERFVGAASRQFHDKRHRSAVEIRKRFDIRDQT